jgi:hypothetical protein
MSVPYAPNLSQTADDIRRTLSYRQKDEGSAGELGQTSEESPHPRNLSDIEKESDEMDQETGSLPEFDLNSFL